jgi:cell division protein FtsZ
MINAKIPNVDFISANTDLQSLDNSLAQYKIQLGKELTKGLGAGANPDVGRSSALETQEEIREYLTGADMVFITAGMGGGTGTGAAPIIASIAREVGALTLAVVTKPFGFEGKKRTIFAEEGIVQLRSCVDTLIVIPNQKLIQISQDNVTLLEAFKKADEVLLYAVKGISDLITVHGLINLDFADVKTIMSGNGIALMGTGISSGEKRAYDAAHKAISSPLLEDVSIDGATGVLMNVTGSSSLTLHEVNEAAMLIKEQVHEEANIIFGASIDESLENQIRVTIIATGFNKFNKKEQLREQPKIAIIERSMINKIKPILREEKVKEIEQIELPIMEQKKTENPNKFINPVLMKKSISNEYLSDDDFEIPTFLRKQVD